MSAIPGPIPMDGGMIDGSTRESTSTRWLGNRVVQFSSRWPNKLAHFALFRLTFISVEIREELVFDVFKVDGIRLCCYGSGLLTCRFCAVIDAKDRDTEYSRDTRE